MSLLRPPRLRKGDLIGVVAPSSPQRDDTRLEKGIRYFESLGYPVTCGENLWKRYGYLAGSDDERAADLNGMFRDPRVRMILCGRGGYGVTRILDRIDYRTVRRDPKIFVGFSDLTALNYALMTRSGLVSFSGGMPGVDFWEEENNDRFAEESFWRAVTSPKPPSPVRRETGEPLTGLSKGIAEGWLLAGNLTILANIIGTPYFPKPDGAVLLIEEIGEEAYRVDRLLSQLYNAGVLRKLTGLAFGAFTGTKPTRVSVDPLPIEEVFAEYLRRADVPAVAGVPYGHVKTKLTLPVGVRVRLNANRGVMTVLESGVV